MSEPQYIRQHGSFASLTPDERRAWFQEAINEAGSERCTFVRASVDDAETPTMALLEGWAVQPADQGAPRWQLTASQ